MTAQYVRTSGLFASLILLALAQSSWAEDAISQLRQSATASLHALEHMRRSYAAVLARDADAKADTFFKITLQNKRDVDVLHIGVHTRGHHAIAAWAWSAGEQAWSHRVDISGLHSVGKLQLHGLRGELDLDLATLATVALPAHQRRARLQVDIDMQGSRRSSFTVDGGQSARLRLPEKGTLVVAEWQAMAMPGNPAEYVTDLTSAQLYALLQAWEKQALVLYNGIRVLRLAQQSGKHPVKLQSAQPLYFPARPSFVKHDKTVAGKATKPKVVVQSKPKIRGPAMDDDADLLGDDLDVDLGEELGDDLAAAPEDPPDIIAKRAQVAEVIAGHLADLQRIAEQQGHSEGALATGARGGLQVDDPEFGPFYGFVPLPSQGKRVNVVPQGSGGPGVQHWPYVGHWQALGPFRGARSVQLSMPDIIPTRDSIYKVVSINTTLMSGTKVKAKHATPETASWRDKVMEPANGMCRPWQMTVHRGHESDKPGLPDASFYLTTTVWSAADCELWAGGIADDHCTLWVNDALVCHWPLPAQKRDDESLALFKIQLRKGSNRLIARLDNGPHSTGLALRLCLRGQPRTAEQAKQQMQAAAQARAQAVAAAPMINGFRGRGDGVYPDATPPIAWDRSSGANIRWRHALGGGKAAPVIAGDKLFVCVDPMFLRCLDKHSGELLWEREMNVLELGDAAVWQESQKLRAAWQDASGDARKVAYKTWWSHVLKHGDVRKGSDWKNFSGHMFATPVTDGQHIWVKCAAGVIACFDMDGNRRWMVKAHFGDTGFSFCSSPVLVDGRLIFELATRKYKYFHSDIKMVGLDAATGSTLWEVPRVYNLQPSSSPVVMHLSNGSESMAVVVTGGGLLADHKKDDLDDVFILGGSVIRADDGKVLIENMGVSSGWSTPNTVGDRIFHIGSTYGSCTRLIMLDKDTVGAKRLWTRITPGFDGGLVHHDGLLCGVQGGQWPSGLKYIDALSGQFINKAVNTNTVFGKFGRGYTPPAFAGKRVYCSDDGTGFGWSPHNTKVFVVQSGKEGRLLARNTLEVNMIAPLVFDGDRIYCRSNASVTCIAYTGAEGKAYEAEVVARTILEDLEAEAPAESDVLPIAALAPTQSTRSTVVQIPTLRDWAMVGPYPQAEAEAVVAAMGGLKSLSVKDKTWRGQALKVNHLSKRSKIKILHKSDKHWFELAPLKAAQQGQVVFYHQLVDVVQPKLLRVFADHPQASLSISGVSVGHGQRIQLQPGRHNIVLRASFADALPTSTLLDLRLLPSMGAAEDRARWQRSLERNRPHLQKVIELRPDSATAQRAKAYLSPH